MPERFFSPIPAKNKLFLPTRCVYILSSTHVFSVWFCTLKHKLIHFIFRYLYFAVVPNVIYFFHFLHTQQFQTSPTSHSQLCFVPAKVAAFLTIHPECIFAFYRILFLLFCISFPVFSMCISYTVTKHILIRSFTKMKSYINIMTNEEFCIFAS